MRKILITESALRGLLRETMDSSTPVNVNPVVDPQSAEVDPTNQNYVPSSVEELLPALRMLISSVQDEDAPEVYVTIKKAVEEKEDDMKNPKVVESLIRKEIRRILKEASPVPPPPKAPQAKIDSGFEDKARAVYDDPTLVGAAKRVALRDLVKKLLPDRSEEHTSEL